jgi:hypothetical protein
MRKAHLNRALLGFVAQAAHVDIAAPPTLAADSCRHYRDDIGIQKASICPGHSPHASAPYTARKTTHDANGGEGMVPIELMAIPTNTAGAGICQRC